MSVHVFLFLLVFFLLLGLALLWRLCWLHHQPSHSQAERRRTTVHGLLKPRIPLDCPVCRLASPCVKPASAPPRSWCEVKSQRGAPKRVNTVGFACPNPRCPYFGITDAQIHASSRRWQAWPCRTNPDLSRPCLSHHVQCSTAHALVPFEIPFPAGRHGADGAGRRTGRIRCRTGLRLPSSDHHYLVVPRWRARSDVARAHVPYPLASAPAVGPLLRTRLRCAKQILWLLLAIDPLTKLVPVLELGPRTQHMAHLLIHALRQSLAPDYLPLFTSDGLDLYFYALTAHLGKWLQVGRRGRNVRRWQVATGLIYGQVKKCYLRRKLMRVRHVMHLGTQADLAVALQGKGFSGRLNTAFIERVNLTVRHGRAALAHLEWWRACYHFVRPHQPLRVALVQPRERGGKLVAQRYRLRTPAMTAGRTNRRWTAREVLACPLPPLSA